jgi:hypothetical protein
MYTYIVTVFTYIWDVTCSQLLTVHTQLRRIPYITHSAHSGTSIYDRRIQYQAPPACLHSYVTACATTYSAWSPYFYWLNPSSTKWTSDISYISENCDNICIHLHFNIILSVTIYNTTDSSECEGDTSESVQLTGSASKNAFIRVTKW